ncbi:hypothetical protein ACWF94_00040 [Streptomyces sp. NPDC055078]
MPGGKRRSRTPAEYVVAGVWPDAELEPHAGARGIQVLARRLRDVMASRSLSANALAKASGVNRQVITNVLNGAVWPDSLTVLGLEHELGADLWPAQDGAVKVTAEDGYGGAPTDVGVLERFVFGPDVLRMMSVEYATILYWHVARFHVAAVSDMLQDLATSAETEPGTADTGEGFTLGEIASWDQEEWLTYHSSACAKSTDEPPC